jgi:transmembrane serine protease 9
MKVAVFLAIVGVAVALPSPNQSGPGFIRNDGTLEPYYGKITGGTDAAPGELPYQISMQVDPILGAKYHTCGGTIVSPTKIVTAAHCVQGQTIRQLSIVAGASNMKVDEPTQQVRSVARLNYNPNFDGNALTHDSAVITLTEPLELNDRVQALRLATQDEPAVGECINSGWGNARANGGTPAIVPDVLQKITLAVVDQDECTQTYSGINNIDETMLCVRGLTQSPNLGSCNGDSGGPLACTDSNGAQYLAGIVSWGMQPCGQYQYPTVFARVAAKDNLDFIQEQINN